MEQVFTYGKAYDDMLEAFSIIESAVTLLDILCVQSLSERDWSCAGFGIGTLLRTANDVLSKGMDDAAKENALKQ